LRLLGIDSEKTLFLGKKNKEIRQEEERDYIVWFNKDCFGSYGSQPCLQSPALTTSEIFP
jgi:hypothetical protein